MSNESSNYVYIVRRKEDGKIYLIYRLDTRLNNIHFYALQSDSWLSSSQTLTTLFGNAAGKGHTLSTTHFFPAEEMKEFNDDKH